MIQIASFVFKYWKHLIVIAIAAGIFYAGYTQGVASCEAETQKQVDVLEDKSNDLADGVEAENREAETKTRTVIRKVYVEKDDSNCADSTAIDSVLSVHNTSD